MICELQALKTYLFTMDVMKKKSIKLSSMYFFDDDYIKTVFTEKPHIFTVCSLPVALPVLHQISHVFSSASMICFN